MMKWLSIFFLVSISSLPAEIFSDDKTGVSVELPAGWHIPENQDFGLLISPPEGRFGIRIKLAPRQRETLWDAINGLIETFEVNSLKQLKKYPYRVIMIEPFEAESGIAGFRVTTGNIEEDGTQIPNVFHYMFTTKAGKPVCVCLYASSGVKTPQAGDALILPTLRLID